MLKGFKTFGVNGVAVVAGLVGYFAQPDVVAGIISSPEQASLFLAILGAANMALRAFTNTPIFKKDK